jgi:tRNA A-37 threonylcarbamoyl transferase component Bud32
MLKAAQRVILDPAARS